MEKLKLWLRQLPLGQGITEDNIRFIFHFTLPKSLEPYFMESNLAGKDERLSVYLVLFTS